MLLTADVGNTNIKFVAIFFFSEWKRKRYYQFIIHIAYRVLKMIILAIAIKI